MSLKFRNRSFAASLVAGLLIASSASAVTARFDFGGTVVQPGFDLVSNAGVGSSGPVGITVLGVGATVDARDRSAGDNGGGAEASMWRDFLFANGSNNPGEGLDINITGLTPNATYPIRLWAFDELSNGGRAALWNGRIMAFTDAPDPLTLNDRKVDTFIRTDGAGNALLQGRVLSNNQEPHHVFVNGLEIGDPFFTAPPPVPANQLVYAIDIDTTFGGTAINTAPGFVSLDATTGDGGNVLIANTYFQVFSADGSRNRNTGDPLTGDFVFDDGAGQAVGVRVFNLPDALWDVEVWAFDTFDAGLQIVGITQTGVGEILFTNSFLSNPTLPFTFRIDSSLLEDGFGVFTRENNAADRSRFNAIRFTRVIPEPATALLGVLGLAGLGMRRRKIA